MFQERFKVVDCAMTQTKKAATKCNAYLTEEWTALPKAAAITVGGMAGFVLGLKRGPVGRLLTTTIGLATMAAFCYPIEAVDVAKTGRAHAEQTWYSFQECRLEISENQREINKIFSSNSICHRQN